jgi:hypothetical protein
MLDPTAEAHLEPEQGHLSLAIGGLGEKLEVLSARVPDRTTSYTAGALETPTAGDVV